MSITAEVECDECYACADLDAGATYNGAGLVRIPLGWVSDAGGHRHRCPQCVAETKGGDHA